MDLLQACPIASARVSRVLVKYSGTRGTRPSASPGKINLAGGGIFRLLEFDIEGDFLQEILRRKGLK
jgi:hypothetical protein